MNNLEKKEKGKNIVIIMLIIILIIALGFICYDKFLIKEKTIKQDCNCPECEKCNTEIEKTKSNVMSELLIDKYLNGEPPANCSTIEYFTNDKKITSNDISNLYAANVVISDMNYLPDTIESNDFTKMIKAYFGKNYDFNVDSLKNSNDLANYQYTDRFVKRSNNWGGTCGQASDYRVIDTKKNGTSLEINIKVLFAGKNENGMFIDKYYSDYSRSNLIKSDENPTDKDFQKGSTYKFIFDYNLDNNQYLFASCELVK